MQSAMRYVHPSYEKVQRVVEQITEAVDSQQETHLERPFGCGWEGLMKALRRLGWQRCWGGVRQGDNLVRFQRSKHRHIHVIPARVARGTRLVSKDSGVSVLPSKITMRVEHTDSPPTAHLVMYYENTPLTSLDFGEAVRTALRCV